jgi:hypothetical protein
MTVAESSWKSVKYSNFWVCEKSIGSLITPNAQSLRSDKYSGISMDGEKAEIILNLEIQFATTEIMEIS